jgi:nicotianamine synthase
MPDATTIVSTLRTSYDALLCRSALSPDDTYAIFRNIENLVDEDEQVASAVLADPFVLSIRSCLRTWYATCVYDLERYWATMLLEKPGSSLSDYPKYEQYLLRADVEFHLLNTIATHQIGTILFVGCGPLPVTAIILADKFNITADYLDVSLDALSVAKAIHQRFFPQRQARWYHTDILKFNDFRAYDAVMVAASVGRDEANSTAILQHLSTAMTPGQYLVLRPPYLLEKLLLSGITLSDLVGFKLYRAELASEDDILYRIFAQKR